MNTVFYQEVVKKVEAPKINEFIRNHGFQPLNPQKVSARQVANVLQGIVERHGVEAYMELQSLLEGSTVKALPEPDLKSGCGCKGCSGCSSKSYNAEGEEPKKAVEPNGENDFLNKHGKLLIFAFTAIAVAYIIKKG